MTTSAKKNLKKYKTILEELYDEKATLKEKIKKTKAKIEKLDLIVNPPWWTKLDSKFSIFQGLIKSSDVDEVSRDEGRPLYFVRVVINFINDERIMYYYEDEYNDGSSFSAWIDDFTNNDNDELYKNLSNILISLDIRPSNKNKNLLLDLLDCASNNQYDIRSQFEKQ